MAFINYEKAFDSVKISAVMQAIRKQGVDKPYIKVLEDIYKGSTATIKLHQESKKIPITKGKRQGDTISSKLFTVCLEEVFINLDWEDIGIDIDDKNLNNLRFADDTVLFSESEDNLQKTIKELNRESLKVGLKINIKKTKVTFNNQLAGESGGIHILGTNS